MGQHWKTFLAYNCACSNSLSLAEWMQQLPVWLEWHSCWRRGLKVKQHPTGKKWERLASAVSARTVHSCWVGHLCMVAWEQSGCCNCSFGALGQIFRPTTPTPFIVQPYEYHSLATQLLERRSCWRRGLKVKQHPTGKKWERLASAVSARTVHSCSCRTQCPCLRNRRSAQKSVHRPCRISFLSKANRKTERERERHKEKREKRGRDIPVHTQMRTHTHTHIYIYIYVCFFVWFIYLFIFYLLD